MGETPESNTQSFMRFRLLPPELRNRIWEIHLPCPRLVSVYASDGEILYKKPGTDIIRRRRRFNHVWADKLPVPTVLQVCHESRTVGLKHYALVFDTNPRPSKETIEQRTSLRTTDETVFYFETPSMIYLDLQRDVLLPGIGANFRWEQAWYPSMPVDTPSLFNNDAFLAEMRDILPKIQYFVDVRRWRQRSEIELILRSMTGLKGFAALTQRRRAGMGFRMECEAIWFGILKKYSTRNLKFRMFENEADLRIAVENETIWDAVIETSQ